MALKRVVVTGLGALTPIGNNLDEFWTGLIEGKSGAAPITYFDTEKFKTKFACEVKDFDVSICASFFLGPITFKPCLSNRSATPSLNGFSGPMTAVEHPTSLAKDSTVSGLLISPT